MALTAQQRLFHLLHGKLSVVAEGLDMGVGSTGADQISTLAEYFLICTGTSNTHVKTLCDYAEFAMEQMEEPLLGREGHRGNSWELLDYGAVVVHVFTEEARDFYNLERLWADAESVDLTGVLLPD